MKISEIQSILDAHLFTPDLDIAREVHTACGSDMMSDVLAYVKNQALLITGLNNQQVVRTASMMDMACIVFVRGKKPNESIIELAKQVDIVLLGTELPMFPTCGLLYEHGLRGGRSA